MTRTPVRFHRRLAQNQTSVNECAVDERGLSTSAGLQFVAVKRSCPPESAVTLIGKLPVTVSTKLSL